MHKLHLPTRKRVGLREGIEPGAHAAAGGQGRDGWQGLDQRGGSGCLLVQCLLEHQNVHRVRRRALRCGSGGLDGGGAGNVHGGALGLYLLSADLLKT
jgi:hypothetical protein